MEINKCIAYILPTLLYVFIASKIIDDGDVLIHATVASIFLIWLYVVANKYNHKVMRVIIVAMLTTLIGFMAIVAFFIPVCIENCFWL